MTEPSASRPGPIPSAGPIIHPPRPFVERRRQFRRAVDRQVDDERRLLAMALDVLASGRAAEARLAGMLDLLARTVGAVRAAVVADGEQRRVAVAASGPDDRPAALELAA